MQVKISQAKEALEKILRARLVALLSGSPGVGKSDLIRQIADTYNLKVIDLRLAQCDPTDLMGFPYIDKETGRSKYTPMETFPMEGDPLPKDYSGWLLFFDELTSAPRSVQAASYKILLDRMIGTKHLHSKVAMVAAGNLDTDGAIVEEMSTALQSRLVHLELVADHLEWLAWATEHQIDHRICSFIRFKPDNLYTFTPDHSDKTYACPRTWEFADRLIQQSDGKVDQSIASLCLFSGCLGEGVAREFAAFCQIYQDLPTMEEILRRPEMVYVSDEPSVLFALTGALAVNMTLDNIPTLMKFIGRLPSEFQVITMKDAVNRNEELKRSNEMHEWYRHSAVELV